MNALSYIKSEIKNLFPAYFAFVMSTGIVSIAAHLLGFPKVSIFLFWINNIAFPILLTMFVFRVIFYFNAFLEDFTLHAKGAGFFTLVAASCILGKQYLFLTDTTLPAIILWYFAFVLWILLIYSFFVIIIVKKEKPPFEKGINGIWLIIVVATQSLSILGILLAEVLPFPIERVIFLMLSGYMLGCMLYIILITLIFYRLVFFPIRAEEFAPPFWINMGAVAITSLAGATLILKMEEISALVGFVPFLKGFSLFFWATGTWWIPIIFFLGIWRHIYKHIPIFYHPQYWGMVFPLGMYTVCTYRLAQALKLPYLELIPSYFIYIAFAAWFLAFLGLCVGLIKSYRQRKIRVKM